MQGDFSRIRFNPAKEYVAVLKQQGRVDLDSDANEQRAIDITLRQTTNVDVIGEFGGPENGAGFAISIDGDRIWISAGHYYVNGILVENPSRMSYNDQPYLIDPGTKAKDLIEGLLDAGEGATLQFVLQVWQRMATALDDPCLLEPALGQADTTTRLQTVWRVVGTVVKDQLQSSQQGVDLQNISNLQGSGEYNPISELSVCCQSMYNNLTSTEHTGEMRAELSQAGSGCGCQPIPAAGYQGLENQLYRVEIQNQGDLTSATFKWSRENGSVETQVTQASPGNPTITVASLGPDANLGFQANQWVELSDDTDLFGPTPNKPGTLYQIYSIDSTALQVTMYTPVGSLDTSKHARMRRWDQSGASATASGIPVSHTPIPLENGIEVAFRKGQFQPGDYWTIPARTANGSIDWPPCGGSGKHYQPSSYIGIDQAPVACVSLRPYNQYADKKGESNENSRFIVNDCRLLFPPLTALTPPAPPAAMHVTAISWNNDDLITVDAFLQQGLSITLDTAPTCPWSGANFQVTLEVPVTLTQLTESLSITANFSWILVSPLADGITLSGDQVNWLLPVNTAGFPLKSAVLLWRDLNTLLNYALPSGAGRVRVKLDGGAVYGNGASGNLYLDGVTFGSTSSRVSDSSPCIALGLPSGNSLKSSDFNGWFYLAPSVVIESAVIQLIESTGAVAADAVTVTMGLFGRMSGLETTVPAGATATPVSGVQVAVTLSYTPIAPLTLLFDLGGGGAGSVVTMPSTYTVNAGETSIIVPITIAESPGVGVTDNVTINVSVNGGLSAIPYGTQLTLAITGGPETSLGNIGVTEPIKFNF